MFYAGLHTKKFLKKCGFGSLERKIRRFFVCWSKKRKCRDNDDTFYQIGVSYLVKTLRMDAHSRDGKMSQATALVARVPQAELFLLSYLVFAIYKSESVRRCRSE